MEKLFTFYVPLMKSEGASDSKRLVCGMASAQMRDAQGEIMFMKGMDFRPALEYGFINWDHKEGPENQIGYPYKGEIVKAEDHPALAARGLTGWAHWVEGELFKGHKRSDDTWSLMKAMEGTDRQLAWSVQGAVIDKSMDGRNVYKSEIRHYAITHQPVLQSSFAQVVKSLSSMKSFEGMSTVSAEPLRLENIDGRITSVLYGHCHDHHYDGNGVFRKGRNSMLEHLVKCRDFPVRESTNLIKALMESVKR